MTPKEQKSLESLALVYFDAIDEEKRIKAEIAQRKNRALLVLQEEMERLDVDEISNNAFYAKWSEPGDKVTLDKDLWDSMVDGNILLFGAEALHEAFGKIISKAKERATVLTPQEPRFMASRKNKRGK